jgi:hypothetical protein
MSLCVFDRSISGNAYELLRCRGLGYFRRSTTIACRGICGFESWTAASTIAHEYPKPWVEWLAYGTAAAVSVTRFTSLQPVRCCSGKHTWVLDRTPHLPCSLQGWSQCGMQCEIVQEDTVSISRKREVTDVEE